MKRVPVSRVEQVVGDFRRVVQFEPGYPLTPGYGRAGLCMRFVIVGDLGAVHFLMSTGWVPGEKLSPELHDYYLSGSHIGFHWKTQPYDSCIHGDECDWLPDGCYFDASYMASDPVLMHFITGGADAVWADLERHYHEYAAEVAKP